MGLLAWSEDIEPSRATTAYVVASGVYFSLLTLSLHYTAVHSDARWFPLIVTLFECGRLLFSCFVAFRELSSARIVSHRDEVAWPTTPASPTLSLHVRRHSISLTTPRRQSFNLSRVIEKENKLKQFEYGDSSKSPLARLVGGIAATHWSVWIVAGLSVLSGNLIFHAAQGLPLAAYIIHTPLKMLFAALAAVLVGRKCSLAQALSMLVVSVAVVGIQFTNLDGKDGSSRNYSTGFTLLFAATAARALCTTYDLLRPAIVASRSRHYAEPIIPQTIRNIQMCFASAVISAFYAIYTQSFDSSSVVGVVGGLGVMPIWTIVLQIIGCYPLTALLGSVGTMELEISEAISILFSLVVASFLSTDSLSTLGLVALSAAGVYRFNLDGPLNRGVTRFSPARIIATTLVLLAFAFYVYSGSDNGDSISSDLDRLKTVSINNIPQNRRLAELAPVCKFPFTHHRETPRAPYGQVHAHTKTPYLVTGTEQYALDDILTTRFMDYPLQLPLARSSADEKPDFIFIPFYSIIGSGGWSCDSKSFNEALDANTAAIISFALSLPDAGYPRIILPIATVRNFQNTKLLTPEVMEALREKVVVVSIESAPLWQDEGMKYLIDVPYPTRWHFVRDLSRPIADVSTTEYFFHLERPYLLQFGGSMTHGSDITKSPAWTGFPVRFALAHAIGSHINSTKLDATASKVYFDDFDLPRRSGHDPIDAAYEHMTKSVFCLNPPGDTPSRRGFYDAILLGCIPVIFRKSYGRLLPSSPELDPSLYTIYIPENEIINSIGPSLIARLEAISQDEISRKQLHLMRISRKLQYTIPTAFPPRNLHRSEWRLPTFEEDAFGALLLELSRIKSGRWKGRTGIEDLRSSS